MFARVIVQSSRDVHSQGNPSLSESNIRDLVPMTVNMKRRSHTFFATSATGLAVWSIFSVFSEDWELRLRLEHVNCLSHGLSVTIR